MSDGFMLPAAVRSLMSVGGVVLDRGQVFDGAVQAGKANAEQCASEDA